MDDVVNLRRARKQKARTAKDKSAAANRAIYGRTKAEKVQGKTETLRDAARLDMAKLTPKK